MVDQNREDELRGAIELMYFGYRAFTEGPDRILDKRGLNRMHHRILYFIGRSPGASVSDLLETLKISKQALHSPMRQLIAMNLVSNDKAEHDGRIRQLRLTASGRRLEAQLTGTQMKQLASLFSSSGRSTEKSWREIMQKMADNE
ncbi:MAG: MarR family transcriptional regulator [Granulosicoccus sp.]|nr:MarR family transcriptional regulator [Granulosicoccus sp.]